MKPKVCFVNTDPIPPLHYVKLPTNLLSAATYIKDVADVIGVYPPWENIPQCDLLVIESSITGYPNAITVARRVDANKTLLCGEHVSTETASAMRCPFFHFGIIGDLDEALLKLVTGELESIIDGLAYRCRGILILNSPRSVKCSELTIPCYELWRGQLKDPVGITFERYKVYENGLCVNRKSWTKKHYYKFAIEMNNLKRLGVSSVVLEDQDFCGNKTAIAALDKMRGWEFTTVPESVLQNRLDQRIVGSNCRTVRLNIRTASERLLGEYDWPDIEKQELAMELLVRGSKVSVILVVTLGWPGETVDSLTESLLRIRAWGLRTQIQTFVPRPGTKFYEDHTTFRRFGFMINDASYHDFYIDDTVPIFSVPWKSKTISTQDFIDIRNSAVREFNNGEQHFR